MLLGFMRVIRVDTEPMDTAVGIVVAGTVVEGTEPVGTPAGRVAGTELVAP